MSIKALSLEKRKIIDTLLAEYGITIEELFHCYELNRKYQYKSFASRYLSKAVLSGIPVHLEALDEEEAD